VPGLDGLALRPGGDSHPALSKVVGAVRIELTLSCSQNKCLAARLRSEMDAGVRVELTSTGYEPV
jgi:hypothetical protein